MLRDATPADHAELRLIFRRASLSNEGDRAPLLADPQHLVWREPAATAGRVRVRVAVGAGGVIGGFASLVLAGDVAELEDLFVDPDHMRRGIGRALVADARRLAAGAGCSTLAVTANPHAAAFYAAAGFAGTAAQATALGVGTRLTLDLRRRGGAAAPTIAHRHRTSRRCCRPPATRR
jgi:GNAT superfamily N-acetyltransferase